MTFNIIGDGIVIKHINDIRPSHRVWINVKDMTYYQDGMIYYKKIQEYKDTMSPDDEIQDELVYDVCLTNGYNGINHNINPNDCQVVVTHNGLNIKDRIINMFGDSRVGGKYTWSVIKNRLIKNSIFNEGIGKSWLERWKTLHYDNFIRIKNKLYADCDLIMMLVQDMDVKLESFNLERLKNKSDNTKVLAFKKDGLCISLQDHYNKLNERYIPIECNTRLGCHMFGREDANAMKLINFTHDILKCQEKFQQKIKGNIDIDVEHYIGGAMIAYALCQMFNVDEYTMHFCIITDLMHHCDSKLLQYENDFKYAIGRVSEKYPKGFQVDVKDGIAIRKFYDDNYKTLRCVNFQKTDFIPGIDSTISTTEFVNWLDKQTITDKDFRFCEMFQYFDGESYELLKCE